MELGAHRGDDALLRAVADNHRDWMARWAVAAGGGVVSVDGQPLYLSPEANLFPPSPPDPDRLIATIRGHDCAGVGYWSLHADDRVGVRLVARGFGWGWRPHWMGIDLDDPQRFAPSPEPGFTVGVAAAPFARTLPYAPADGIADPPGVFRLGVRLRAKLIGQIAMLAVDGVAGLYSMGVAPRVRGRGIATELTRAACRLAIEHGCRHAVLNATDDGERVYRRVGFRSLGSGQTWWYFRRPAPTAREIALTEAVGFGDVETLETLALTDAELAGPLPGDEPPLVFALQTGQVDAGGWILDRLPSLADVRYEPHDTTLLHLAAEYDSLPFAELALTHGVDRSARDATFSGTALGWAEHFGRDELAVRLREAAS